MMIEILLNSLAAGLAALGFAVLFNMPRRILWLCVLAAIGGDFSRGSAMSAGFGIEAGTLVGSLVIGISAQAFSRVARVPAMVLALPAAIPFVPGALAFQCILGLLSISTSNGQVSPEFVSETLANGLRSIFILVGIAAGISLPGLLLFRHVEI